MPIYVVLVLTTRILYPQVLLGESGVGKSSIAARFVRNVFDELQESTIGGMLAVTCSVLVLSMRFILFQIVSSVQFEFQRTVDF